MASSSQALAHVSDDDAVLQEYLDKLAVIADERRGELAKLATKAAQEAAASAPEADDDPLAIPPELDRRQNQNKGSGTV